jgi:hypothetical protein
MLNEYFRKWCCIIVVDHICVHGRLNSSLDETAVDRLNGFVQQIGCSCHVYSEKSTSAELFTIFSLSHSGNNPVEHAFESAFDKGYRKVILLDARQEVPQMIIEEAFSSLKMIEFCLGPEENSCYLFGMNFFDRDFFNQVPAVFLADKKVLLRKAGEMHLAVYKTPLLKDRISQE